MKIGICYDLRADYLAQGFSLEETAELDKEETIAGIESALQALGHATVRIGGAHQLLPRLVAGERWDLVFNIAEGMFGTAREAQVPAILDLYRIPYTFSEPLVLALCLHKGLTKQVIRDLKIPTPDFVLVNSAADISRVNLPFPLFAKPVAEGTSKGIDACSKIEDRTGLEQTCLNLLVRFRQPVLVETFLPGREFTVGILGTGSQARVIGAMEIGLQATAVDASYSYHSKANYQECVSYHPVSDGTLLSQCRVVALNVWQGLGCRDAGRVDLRMDAAGVLNFIEVNPLAGLNPVHSDLPILSRFYGLEYQDLIENILQSALERNQPGLTA